MRRAAALLLLCAAFVVLPALPASAGTCGQTSATTVDPNTGWRFTSRWTCGNTRGARLYGDAAYGTPTAYMDSTTSWFLCYRRGEAHSGGNDVWYYTLGDRPFPGMEARGNWGYMPAVDVYTSTDPWPGMAPCPEAFSPPARTDGRRPVLFVHGYDTAGDSCSSVWANAKQMYRNHGWTDAQLKTVTYYGDYTGCDYRLYGNGTRDIPIEQLGNSLAWLIWNTWSKFGVSIDIVAHSMGGLVTRAAITGTQYPGTAPSTSQAWPPYLYVEDVSTLSTPHAGAWASSSITCIAAWHNTQCRQMSADDPFMRDWIQGRANPQAQVRGGRGGTDWTIEGAADDGLIYFDSALDFDATAKMGHKILYNPGQGLSHAGMRTAGPGSYGMYYCDYYNPCDMTPPFANPFSYPNYDLSGWNTNGAGTAPVEVAMWGNYYANGR
ncbi:esterase/lipase family protein [Dactylosporangium sp. CS-047395]|uniref:esterase/lipase family protein n=1 Tax=Dactylosporangium sp. CS-047395 TaxID=3239936 RepID=UPI003D8F4277